MNSQLSENEHTPGPDCPVTWREERLATLLLETVKEVENLKEAFSSLLKKRQS